MKTDSKANEFEHAIADNIIAEMNTSGNWYLKNTQSGMVSKELFISPRIASKALDGNLFTWTNELHE